MAASVFTASLITVFISFSLGVMFTIHIYRPFTSEKIHNENR